MPLLAAGSELVAGSVKDSTMAQAQAQLLPVKVTRAFYYKGEALKVGDVVELPSIFAREMQAARKGQIVQKQESKQEPPQEYKPEPVKAEAKKGEK